MTIPPIEAVGTVQRLSGIRKIAEDKLAELSQAGHGD